MEAELSGLTELVAKMERARVDMGGKEMKKALRAGGKVFKEAIIERIPPSLQGSIPGADSLNPGDLAAEIRVAVIDGDNGPEALIGPNSKVTHVMRWLEYGHRQISGGYSKLVDGKTRGPGVAGEDIPAYPVIRPAFEESAGEALSAERDSLQQSFQEVMR
jgi:hypothetical protein